MSEPRTDGDRHYWERHASKYDLSLGPLGKPLPRMLELVAEAAQGRPRVLEVAAGTGLVTPVLARAAGAVVATDYAAAMVARLLDRVAAAGLENVECRQADIYSLPFEPGTFDAVVAANVLHLVPDLEGALAALTSMLRPDGILISTDLLPRRDSDLLGRLAPPGCDGLSGASTVHDGVTAGVRRDRGIEGRPLRSHLGTASDWLRRRFLPGSQVRTPVTPWTWGRKAHRR